MQIFDTLLQLKLCGHATLAAAYILFTSSLMDSSIVEFVTVSGIVSARKIPEIKANDGSNLQIGESIERFLIELDFPTTSMTDFNSTEVSTISNALNGASVMDIKWETTKDDLIVMPPCHFLFDFIFLLHISSKYHNYSSDICF